MSELNTRKNFLNSLPGDHSASLQSRSTPGAIYSTVQPTAVKAPQLLAWSESAAQILNLSKPNELNDEVTQFLSGNRVFADVQPFSTRYGGHQFGHWAGQLGDGRAITLAEVLNLENQNWEIQLKGAGRTPYSRRGDGRAVLRSSLREFICSEAMFHLNIPTTRALSCITTGELVLRDLFYDGHPKDEDGAIVARLAPTFLRFGHFEILAADNDVKLLKDLVSFTIQNYFPGFDHQTEDHIAEWFSEICRRTAFLMSEWMRVGFIHAVMNTDNMSILGLTIDYGPFSFLDHYDPDWTPNTTDAENRRYRFAAQPEIGFWNLIKLAESLLALVRIPEKLENGLKIYKETYNQSYFKMMAQKLGLKEISSPEDFQLLKTLDQVLRCEDIDMTIFYHKLSHIEQPSDFIKIREAYYSASPSAKSIEKMESWLEMYLNRRANDSMTYEEIKKIMGQVNPIFIPRNYLIQNALDELEKGDRSILDDLLIALKTPYEENEYTMKFYGKRPDWARHRPGCSSLSCSS